MGDGDFTPLAGHPLIEDTAFQLGRLGAVAVERLRQALKPLDLRPLHYAALVFAAAVEGASQREIVDALSVKPSTMVGLLDELERRGLARRSTGERDRRSHAIFITDRGAEILDEARDIAARVQEELLGPLADDDRRTLHDLLARLDAGPVPSLRSSTEPE
ncbi:MAG: MarR family transcriptional regulator [Actinobacteria bacterium]|nr:MarR family transcriptional regulator [Actinomycetota bacterium]